MRNALLAVVLVSGQLALPLYAQAPAAAVAKAAPGWLGPVIAFVQFLFTTYHPAQDKKKDPSGSTRADLTSAQVAKMNEDADRFAKLPKILFDAHELRRDAINLAQLIDIGRDDAVIANALWPSANELASKTQTEFNAVYSSADVQALVFVSSEDRQKVSEARDHLDAIVRRFAHAPKTAAARFAAFGDIKTDLVAVTPAAQLPETWMIDESTATAKSYKALIDDMRKATGNAAPKTAYGARGPFYLASLSLGNTLDRLPSDTDYGAIVRRQIEEPIRAPQWVVVAVNRARTEQTPDWGGRFGSLIAGIVLGATAMFFYNTRRPTPTPTTQDELRKIIAKKGTAATA